ncbi:MAG: DUF4112 domain-containing protein [Chitinophagales bacterium]|nr:DUF4112 domain-containing protein [Chitinophagales bacterium]MCZ2393753.1 DUF4112 domain-containing protein [Chitinophagales bacterium]
MKGEPLYQKVPKDLQNISRIVKLMDSSIKIPFLRKTIGLEPIIGLVPVIGNYIGFIISGSIMVALLKNNGSGKVIAKMSVNIFIDILLSIIPFLGSILDFFFKTNERNLKLALDHYQYGKNQGSAWSVLIPVILFLFSIFTIVLVAMVYLFYMIYDILQNLF